MKEKLRDECQKVTFYEIKKTDLLQTFFFAKVICFEIAYTKCDEISLKISRKLAYEIMRENIKNGFTVCQNNHCRRF